MNTLKRGFIILVAGLFLAVVSIGGAQAATTLNSSKMNTSDKVKAKTQDQQHAIIKTGLTDKKIKSTKDTKGTRNTTRGIWIHNQ